MTKQVDLHKYMDFVQAVTSQSSNNVDVFIARLQELSVSNETWPKINTPLLLTAAIGLGSESGEFSEVIKKMFFQGKPFNEKNLQEMKSELGDIFWYWTNACRALALDPNEVIEANVEKLKSRYPGGEFDPHLSENRKQGDL